MLKTTKNTLVAPKYLSKQNVILCIVSCLLICLGLLARLHNIEFGLSAPSYYADEPEFTEFAINYAFNLKSIINNGDTYKLIPVSFVYGTAPTYILTVVTIVLSKVNSLVGNQIDRTYIYIGLRIFTTLLSLGIAILTGIIAYKLTPLQKSHQGNTQNKYIGLIALSLGVFNWKLIVMGHYVNADIFLTLFLWLSFLFMWMYTQKQKNSFVLIAGVFFGLAFGTKVTALISIPAYIYIFLKNRKVYDLYAFVLSALGSFMVTNPFSIIFNDKFVLRVLDMVTKEGGLVFDSVDTNPVKYLVALSTLVTLPILLLAIPSALTCISQKKDKTFHIFLLSNLLIYVVFFSIQARIADRWLLPIIPIIMIYASYTIYYLIQKGLLFKLALILLLSLYACYTLSATYQFTKETPRSAAYQWIKQNLPPSTVKLYYTEEGLDPLTKIPSMKVTRMGVYESEGGQLILPDNPYLYDYIIIADKPMTYFKKNEVKVKYPYYVQRWQSFENSVQDSGDFVLVKAFTTSKANLIPLTNMYVYQRVNLVCK